jgi:hypothetical protein
LFSISPLFFTCDGTHKAATETLLREISSREHLTRFPEKPHTLKQASRYNRKTVSERNHGWYANDDTPHFVRVEHNIKRREFVFFD